MGSSRFIRATSALDLDVLLQGLRRALWAGLGLAAAAHLLIVGVNPWRQTLDRSPRPLTTRFIKRQPRLTKPLELRKVPRPQRQLLRRQVSLLSARMDQVRAAATFSTRGVLGQVTAPASGVYRAARFASLQLEPTLHAGLIRGSRQPENKVDLALEMLDIDAMDTGRYRAMVIQDPADPQALKGFVKVARVYAQQKSGGQHWDRAEMNRNLTIKSLVENLNRFTGIESEYLGHLTLDDSRMLEVAFVIYMSMDRLTDRELAGTARYLMAGGFVMGHRDWTEALEKYGSLMRGRDFHYGRIPDDHAVYHSFFEMGNAAPPGSDHLMGLWIGDRLAAITGFSLGSSGYGVRYGDDVTRHQQFAVNVMVYALTQEGSITQRLMQMVE